jgi:hypothetical protein
MASVALVRASEPNKLLFAGSVLSQLGRVSTIRRIKAALTVSVHEVLAQTTSPRPAVVGTINCAFEALLKLEGIGFVTNECPPARQDLGIAESQLRDYQAPLGMPFLRDAHLAELTTSRDQLKAGLSGATPSPRQLFANLQTR